MGIAIDRFRLLREFVVREGRPFATQSYPPGCPRKEQGLCHWESLRMAVGGDLIYVEGFALTFRAKIAVLHGWCIDRQGRVIDCTWQERGIAYFGIPFRPEFARQKLELFETMREGPVTASLLNDPTDDFALLNGRTQGWKLL